MNRWILFAILLAIGLVLYFAWIFFSQRQVMYMSLLLYRNGDADTYLKELESAAGRFFFNRKLRTLMAIDANLFKGDTVALNTLFAQAAAYKLSSSDRLLVLQKELLFRIDQHENDAAERVYAQIQSVHKNLTETQMKRYVEMMKEVEYQYTINVKRDGKFAAELMERAKHISESVPAGVCYIRAAQSYVLKGEADRCRKALSYAAKKLQETVYFEKIQGILESEKYEDILESRI